MFLMRCGGLKERLLCLLDHFVLVWCFWIEVDRLHIAYLPTPCRLSTIASSTFTDVTEAPNVMALLRLLVFVFLLSLIRFWRYVMEYSIVNALSLSGAAPNWQIHEAQTYMTHESGKANRPNKHKCTPGHSLHHRAPKMRTLQSRRDIIGIRIRQPCSRPPGHVLMQAISLYGGFGSLLPPSWAGGS